MSALEAGVVLVPVTCEDADALRESMRALPMREVDGGKLLEFVAVDGSLMVADFYPGGGQPAGCFHFTDPRIARPWPGAEARCSECSLPIEADDVRAGYGLCGSCLHNAVRSGWVAGS